MTLVLGSHEEPQLSADITPSGSSCPSVALRRKVSTLPIAFPRPQPAATVLLAFLLATGLSVAKDQEKPQRLISREGASSRRDWVGGHTHKFKDGEIH